TERCGSVRRALWGGGQPAERRGSTAPGRRGVLRRRRARGAALRSPDFRQRRVRRAAPGRTSSVGPDRRPASTDSTVGQLTTDRLTSSPCRIRRRHRQYERYGRLFQGQDCLRDGGLIWYWRGARVATGPVRREADTGGAAADG